MHNIAQIELTTIDGQRRPLGDFLGRATLVVNVASQCGFTPQYAGLEALYRQHRDAGLAVLGFPCNQFGHQEPGDESEIQRFCALQYGVSFPLFAKLDVNGANAHPLYRHIKAAAPGVLGTCSVKWNFTKFLLNAQGGVVARFAPQTKPGKLEREVLELLRG